MNIEQHPIGEYIPLLYYIVCDERTQKKINIPYGHVNKSGECSLCVCFSAAPSNGISPNVVVHTFRIYEFVCMSWARNVPSFGSSAFL